MSKLFILPFVKQREVAVIYQKFDPFPVQSRIIYWCEKTLKGLGFAIACTLIVGLSESSEKSIIFLVAFIAMYGVICFWTLFWKLRLEQEKWGQFSKMNPHLL